MQLTRQKSKSSLNITIRDSQIQPSRGQRSQSAWFSELFRELIFLVSGRRLEPNFWYSDWRAQARDFRMQFWKYLQICEKSEKRKMILYHNIGCLNKLPPILPARLHSDGRRYVRCKTAGMFGREIWPDVQQDWVLLVSVLFIKVASHGQLAVTLVFPLTTSKLYTARRDDTIIRNTYTWLRLFCRASMNLTNAEHHIRQEIRINNFQNHSGGKYKN